VTSDSVKHAGDSALLLELGESVIDPELNARAIAVARAVREQAIPGVRDVVSTFRSVAVFFDPLSADVAAVAAALHHAENAAPSSVAERTVDIPVVYGDESGPDLAELAAFARCTPEAVIERHAGTVYRVYMLGFLPGFPYMAHVDATIAAPRRAIPRLRVAAGSVGVAGRQTGIYPRESPGGWQIIGRTALTLFDQAQLPPALLAPGDRVRFIPTPTSALSRFNRTEVHLKAGTTKGNVDRFVSVLRPGLLTTVQDLGRWGHQSLGVSVAGPMDPVAHRVANALVGNPVDAATLETTLIGPDLRFGQDTVVAIAGGDLWPMLDGAEAPICAPFRCPSGSVLRFGDRRSGARAYVAFDGGVEVDPLLGSRATHVMSRMGGVQGRALRAGDRVALGLPTARAKTRPFSAPRSKGGARVRVLPGPQADQFDEAALDALQRKRFTISAQSDRMGYRLLESTIAGPRPGDMISDVMLMGGVQIPPSGEPILLMADRQTTGGYPQLAVVITADLPLAAQLGPGDWIEFEVCRRADAIAALVAAEGKILAFG
jgi:KipI family sensor histidine kinase inhibitor